MAISVPRLRLRARSAAVAPTSSWARNVRSASRHCRSTAPATARLVAYASGLGIAVPRTEMVDGRAGLAGAVDRIAYPAVVKPVRSRIPTANGYVAGTAHYVRSRAELERVYDEHAYLAEHP